MHRSAWFWSMAMLFILALGTGCASHRATVTTETTRYSSAPVARADEIRNFPSDSTVTEKETTSRTETESREESTGLLSGTVRVVGQTLALPFRFVGGLLGVIF